ncbi:hypothetical protein ACIGH6_12570 [Brachybacterium paraconglomeratum]|uniref:hypothetical protein n=1 Tax=Brachybacterium paraconglomeratum TaxID=173362 RepID=UPI0037C4F26D
MTTPPGDPDPAAPHPESAAGPVPSYAAVRPEPRGTIAWALGFLAYVPIPFVNVLVAGITQLVVGLRQRRHGGLAAENGVRAANWGLTQLCWPVLMAVSLAVGALTGEHSETGVRFAPVMEAVVVAVVILYFVLGLMQLIYAIVGTVQASRGARVGLPVIPFLRRPRG